MKRRLKPIDRVIKRGGATFPMQRHSPIFQFSKRAKQLTLLVEESAGGAVNFTLILPDGQHTFFGIARDYEAAKESLGAHLRHYIPKPAHCKKKAAPMTEEEQLYWDAMYAIAGAAKPFLATIKQSK